MSRLHSSFRHSVAPALTGARITACFVASVLVLAGVSAQPSGDFVQRVETANNSITIEKKGTIVEMRARANSRGTEYLESAVDLSDPLRLVVPYTRTLYAAEFFRPDPGRVLMVGLGGGGFHRLFSYAYPRAVLHTVELDEKVEELAQKYMGFRKSERLPVTAGDGRRFVKHNKEQWDWLILDAFRGGFVPPHLKTQEFYRECAARLSERGVFVTNLHDNTQLFYSDLKTLASVFPQVVLFRTGGRGNVIACAVNYKEPDMGAPAGWGDPVKLSERFEGRLNLEFIRDEHMAWPAAEVAKAKLLTDDFSPVEFLNIVETNNTTKQ